MTKLQKQRRRLFLSLSLSLHSHSHFSKLTLVSQYQNVSILDIIGAKDDERGGDNWS